MYKISAKQLILFALITAVTTGLVLTWSEKLLGHKLFDRTASLVQPTAIADPSVASEEDNNIQIYKAVSPGVVNITARGYSQGFWGIYPSADTGSGSIIDARGDILTNYHVIVNATTQLTVQIENQKYSASIVGVDRDDDLAVIKVTSPPRQMTAVKLGSSTGLEVGQKVLAIGNPFGFQKTMTRGIISGLERPLRDPIARRTIEGAIQTDASINPGNSGGPLLNSRGEMIGINTAIYSPDGQGNGGSIGIGFAVPVDLAKKIIPDLLAKGYVSRPWLGFSTIPLGRNIARAFSLPVQQGLIVEQVYRGTGGAEAGIRGSVITESIWGGANLDQLGDVVVAINGKEVGTTEDLQNALNNKSPGETVRVGIIRNGREMTVPVRLSERPREQQ
ncbi:MAG TPA: trypsin-like peptidase domain-containing protein [Blastocatellia bacterium]|nr:trypsin-like peptidase domain-containing protein [Blastocatellia bacterium]